MADIFTPTLCMAAIGGLTSSLLNLLEIGHLPKDRRPDLKDLMYWFGLLLGPLLGGLVGFLYSEGPAPLGRLVSFQLGLSAPLILRSAANAVPSVARPTLQAGA